MKKQKKEKRKTTFKKNHSVEQETNIVIGKLISWGFLLCLLVASIVCWVASESNDSFSDSCFFLVIGILLLVFGVYNFAGLLFKWDHARVCSKSFLKIYKIDIRNAWSKQDKKDNLTVTLISTILGLSAVILSFFQK